MADPVPAPAPAPANTNPLAPGATTSEGAGSKFVVGLSAVIAALGTITTILSQVSDIIPPAKQGLGLWIGIGGIVVAGITQIAYTIQRGIVKAAAIAAGQTPPADPTLGSSPASAAGNLGATK